MLVRDRMTLNPVTVTPDTAVSEALSLMRQRKFRRLPILDKKGHLVGIVSEKDLLYASPSPATSLNVYEIGYLLSRLKIKDIMTKDVVTVSEDAPIEEAARIMVDHGIGGLPVVRGDALIGIITETDIFKTLIEMIGAREVGIRLTLKVQDKPGTLSQLAAAIAGVGGDIVSLGTFYSEDGIHGRLTVKVCCVDKEVLTRAVEASGAEILDIRVP